MDKLRCINILLFNNVNILDVAGPAQAFSSANDSAQERYRLRYVSVDGAAVTSSCGLKLSADAIISEEAIGDLLIPGGGGVDLALQDQHLRHLIQNWQNTDFDRRVISICSGAMLVANAGLLDGRKATTHWRRGQQARRQFPAVLWSTDELYHIDGSIFTSAGVTSGIDLSLEIIRRDCGSEIALSVARELVVYLKRSGGQSQFADLLEAQFSSDPELSRLITALHQEPGLNWTLERMADVAGMTPRTLSRRFSTMTGYSPVKFLERYRVKRAADVISNGVSVGKSIDLSGFNDFQQMQRAFKRHLGTTVGSYQQKFANPD